MIALLLAILLLGQVLVIPLAAAETVRIYPEVAHLRFPGIIGCRAIAACAQLVLLGTWRLLSMVAEDSLFRPTAFRIVDAIIATVVAATVLFLTAFVVLATANAMNPGVMIIVVVGMVGGTGLGLLLVVMRGLLTKATELEQDLVGVV